MSYANVPPPESLSGRPNRPPNIEDRKKDEQKVQEVGPLFFRSFTWSFQYNKLSKGYRQQKNDEE